MRLHNVSSMRLGREPVIILRDLLLVTLSLSRRVPLKSEGPDQRDGPEAKLARPPRSANQSAALTSAYQRPRASNRSNGACWRWWVSVSNAPEQEVARGAAPAPRARLPRCESRRAHEVTHNPATTSVGRGCALPGPIDSSSPDRSAIALAPVSLELSSCDHRAARGCSNPSSTRRRRP